MTPQGLFDGSSRGREKVMVRKDDNLDVIPIDRFFQDFYYPGLLAEIWAGKRPTPGKALPTSPAPQVRLLASPTPGGAANAISVDVAITDRGGGLSGPWVRHNSVAIPAGKLIKEEGKTKTYRFNLSLVSGDNKIEARSATADGARESDPAIEVVPFAGRLPE